MQGNLLLPIELLYIRFCLCLCVLVTNKCTSQYTKDLYKIWVGSTHMPFCRTWCIDIFPIFPSRFIIAPLFLTYLRSDLEYHTHDQSFFC